MAPKKIKITYSDEEIIASLKWAATGVEGVMSSQIYSALARKHHLPSLPTIFDRFDTWNAALTEAGLETNPSRREFYARTSETVMLDAIRKCTKSLGRFPTLVDYDEWRKDNEPAAPSSVLIRKRLGGWLKAIERMSLRG